MSEDLDIAIIGAGPAGLTAGLYAIRTGRRVKLFEQFSPGGQAATTWQVDNYPGLPHINGAELMMKMEAQAKELGLEVELQQVKGLEAGTPHLLHCADGTVRAKTVIMATGASPKLLNIPGEKEYRGKGVSYCATCDGAFFRNVPVVVVGGGNTALEEADFLTRFASKVYLVHRREQFRADKIIQDHVLKNPKLEIMTPYVLEEINGDGQGVQSVNLSYRGTRECKQLDVQGVFIFVGLTPQNAPFQNTLACNDDGYFKTSHALSTSVSGIFAAGDCRDNTLKQIVVAAGEGATAAMMADRYIQMNQALNMVK